ncbi:phosphoribosyltransferase family protein (plasmid) [Arthrobacter agilis]|uniref:phosphoribosyltransferase family protein n=1 Tax=Arthrobacter agilis TaxID=37921 RepID=UPI002366D964|nr:phosphoribosyltransferase family protein [Arthrobacter agilis]WDF35248.1 phosphoribosyltransferase family protein [Arthrobacter agilis]
MTGERDVATARQSARQHFRWIDGHADTWTMLRDADSLSVIVRGLARLAGGERPDVIAGIESRGFALGPAVAVALGVGFAPLRKDGGMFPGDTVQQVTDADYRGNTRTLLARKDHFERGQRVVLVDDWIETGSQAITASQLITTCEAELVAVVVIVDEASTTARSRLPPIRTLLTAAELP